METLILQKIINFKLGCDSEKKSHRLGIEKMKIAQLFLRLIALLSCTKI
jgi:hypothetical protein